MRAILIQLWIFGSGVLKKLLQAVRLTDCIIVKLSDLGSADKVLRANKNKNDYGLQVGDKIKSIEGMRVYTTNDVTTGFSRCSNENVNLVVERDGKDVKLKVKFNTED